MDQVYIKKPYFMKFPNKDLITIDELISEYEELWDDYNRLEEQFEDFKQDVNDNYKPISQAEQIGWNENW